MVEVLVLFLLLGLEGDDREVNHVILIFIGEQGIYNELRQFKRTIIVLL